MLSVLPWRQSMFRVADGNLSVDEIVADQQAVAASGGRSFDDSRYFRMDGQLIHFKGMFRCRCSQQLLPPSVRRESMVWRLRLLRLALV